MFTGNMAVRHQLQQADVPWEDALALEIIQVDIHLKAVKKICTVGNRILNMTINC